MLKNALEKVIALPVEGVKPSTYQLLDFYGALRRLVSLRTAVDAVKAELFRELSPETVTRDRRGPTGTAIGELHSIEYDPKFEDTFALYDFVMAEDEACYLIKTERYEIVDGDLVCCGVDYFGHMPKSAYHHRRRKRKV